MGARGLPDGDSGRPDRAFERAPRPDSQEGLAEIYDRYARFVYGIALGVLRNRQDAEDVTQEVFATLVRQASYDPSRGSLGTYLSTLARSRAIDRLRGRARQVRAHERLDLLEPDADERGSPVERIYSREFAGRVADAVSSLPEDQRRLLELAYFGGLSQSEIAEQLGAPLGTVKSRTRAALRHLRSMLRHFRE